MKTLTSTQFYRQLTASCAIFLAATAVAESVQADDATAAEQEKRAKAEKGFAPLLEGDGRETWVGYGLDGWPLGWELADGVLHRKGGGGDLRTVKKYGNFELRFQWKVAPGGNSGVIYRAKQQDAPAYRTGPEFQILDNASHGDGKNPLTSAGALYGLYAPAKDAAKRVGQWNSARIVVRGDRVRHFLNDEKVVECELGSDDWNHRVAESKFAEWPEYGKMKRGHIVLQDHGDEVWFRNMRIKEFKKAK